MHLPKLSVTLIRSATHSGTHSQYIKSGAWELTHYRKVITRSFSRQNLFRKFSKSALPKTNLYYLLYCTTGVHLLLFFIFACFFFVCSFVYTYVTCKPHIL